MQYRRSSFLNNPEWQNVPWQNSPKDVYQKLYDRGFALAAVLLEIDNVGTLGADTSIAILSKFLHRLSERDADLDAWYMEIIEESPSPLYWLAQTSTTSSNARGSRMNEGLEQQPHAPFAFHTLRLACITVTYWALRIMLSNTIALTCGAILHTNTADRATASQGFGIFTMAEQLGTANASPYRLELATNIMRAMPYCLNDSMGLLGAQKSLFALRTALFSLRRHPGEELKWCQAVYQELDGRKGLRYAREIAQLDGKWSASGRDSLPIRLTDESGNEVPGPGVQR